MAKSPVFSDFEEFWPYYVGEHREPLCRKLHFVGTGTALCMVGAAVVTGNPVLLLGAPVVGYSCSWFGHFVIERNRPATFSHPLWSLRGDFRMFHLIARGKMDAEVTRFYGSARPTADAPLQQTSV